MKVSQCTGCLYMYYKCHTYLEYYCQAITDLVAGIQWEDKASYVQIW